MRNKLLCAFLATLMLAGCAGDHEMISVSSFAFDTVISVSAFGVDEDELAALADVSEYEALFSRTRSESEIARINAGEVFEHDRRTEYLLRQADGYIYISHRFFEPKIGALVELWDITNATTPPSDAAIRAAMNEEKLDLGGIAKGYSADLIAEKLKENNVNNALIEFGGDCLTVGAKPDGSPWRVGIQKPYAPKGECVGYVEISDCAAATSGVYERYFEYEGVRYHHILDPFTGYPAVTDVLSATVICASACDADALATICVLLGADAALELIEEFVDTECVLILDDGSILTSSGASFTAY